MAPEEILLEKSGWHYNFQMSANLAKEGLATTKSHTFTHGTLYLALGYFNRNYIFILLYPQQDVTSVLRMFQGNADPYNELCSN